MSTTQNPPLWNGDYNPRGASLTFTNAEGLAFMYYFCLIDFPSCVADVEGLLTPNGVSEIQYPGTFDYNTETQYLAIDRTLVYYKSSYYYCTKDTIGAFDEGCWLSAGPTSYQLNFQYMDGGAAWPGAKNPDTDTIKTFQLPIFTTSSSYDPTKGPIVSMQITCQESDAAALTGNPNSKRPPIVNLPLGPNGGATYGIPQVIVFSSATDYTDWVVVCVNTGRTGSSNNIGFLAGANNVYLGTIATNAAQTGLVAAMGAMHDTTDIAGFTINGGAQVNLPNPLSSNPLYYQL
jgi:hypothetical protein